MILSKELRIGSLFYPLSGLPVRIPQQVPFKIVELHAFSVRAVLADHNPATVEHWQTFNYSDISPIPLTKEMLLNLGFTADMLGGVTCSFFGMGDVDLNGNLEFEVGDRVLTHPIKYLHMLQNLWFAIETKELDCTNVFKNAP